MNVKLNCVYSLTAKMSVNSDAEAIYGLLKLLQREAVCCKTNCRLPPFFQCTPNSMLNTHKKCLYKLKPTDICERSYCPKLHWKH